jgi:hypothetical protein
LLALIPSNYKKEYCNETILNSTLRHTVSYLIHLCQGISRITATPLYINARGWIYLKYPFIQPQSIQPLDFRLNPPSSAAFRLSSGNMPPGHDLGATSEVRVQHRLIDLPEVWDEARVIACIEDQAVFDKIL